MTARTHYIAPQGSQENAVTVRFGTDATTGNNYDSKEAGKFVKLIATDNYGLCAAGNPIEGVVTSVESATQAGWSIGGITDEGIMWATADGLEATPGTGAIAAGDYVVCGTVVAKGTALTAYAKVCKATNQPGVAIVSTVGAADTAAAIKTQVDAVLVKVASAQANAQYGWRVLSLGTVGTGAVGTTIVVQRVSAAV